MILSRSKSFITSFMNKYCSASTPQYYYKILTPSEAEKFRREDIFHGTSKDLESGFIHMSNSMEQCQKVVERSYKDVPVHILTLSFKRHVNIISERASDGDRYPHLYGIMRYSDVCMEQVV